MGGAGCRTGGVADGDGGKIQQAQFQSERGQVLAGLVVQLTRNASPLVFLGGEQPPLHLPV